MFDRIFEYLDLKHEITDAPNAEPLIDVRGGVTLDHVRFHYDAREESRGGRARDREWTIDDVSLDIAAGSARRARRAERRRQDDDHVSRAADVRRERGRRAHRRSRRSRSLTLDSIADAIGIVTQETYLFHDTIRRNLLYGRPDATQEELEAAARAANIHNRIAELPEGYDTVVGERGYKLSGGEKQRLAIARVILKDPKILILDEATSSLDTTSERLVQAALEPLMQGRTTIAIAHRLSTILAADVIFVLDRGRIVEQGRHEELLALGGLYATLYEQQFARSVGRGAEHLAIAEQDEAVRQHLVGHPFVAERRVHRLGRRHLRRSCAGSSRSCRRPARAVLRRAHQGGADASALAIRGHARACGCARGGPRSGSSRALTRRSSSSVRLPTMAPFLDRDQDRPCAPARSATSAIRSR